MTMSRLIRYQINPEIPKKPKDEVGAFLDGNRPRQFP
jgi:hypothetical protein